MQSSLARKLGLDWLSRYWPAGRGAIEALRMPQPPWPAAEPFPPRLERVRLPEWASDLGTGGCIPVPAHRIAPGTDSPFERTDWLGSACWYIHGCAERAFEAIHGPVHSYAWRMRDWDESMWSHAWGNRIALLLRRDASRRTGIAEAALFGPQPAGEILLTHDIDAVDMTWPLRAKQAAFHGFNAVRLLGRGHVRQAGTKARAALRFVFSTGSLWHIDDVIAMERARGLTGHFFVYGRAAGRSLKLGVIDPQYDLSATKLPGALRGMRAHGFAVGLHQSFDSWADAQSMRIEKERVERETGIAVDSCRQHWLRFSWADTWEAQADAGFRLDATLGFNDRPGFRNGAALRIHPYSERRQGTLALQSVPMLLMDSQLYDYAELDATRRNAEMDRWLGEIRVTGGIATVIWHPHTLGPAYGWRPGFEALLDRIPDLAA